jgi:phosphate transport system substrate-binding protein
MKKFCSVLTVLALVSLGSAAYAGSIRLDGSTTVLPIAQMAVEAFMKENPGVKMTVSGGGSGNGIKALIDGTTDIADASRFIKQEEVSLAVSKGRYPVPFAVAFDSIVPIVHPSNPVKNLTIAQLRDIYTGKITNWKQVGGLNKPIVVIGRETSSGTYECWEEKVLEKEHVTPAAQVLASSGAVFQAVSGNKFAIGYDGIGYVKKGVKAVAVNGVTASPQTTISGQYPISRPLYMMTNGWPTGETLEFINFMQNPKKGQPLVKKAGFVPMY